MLKYSGTNKEKIELKKKYIWYACFSFDSSIIYEM